MAAAALMRGSRGDAVVGAIAVVFIHDLDEVECRSYICSMWPHRVHQSVLVSL